MPPLGSTDDEQFRQAARRLRDAAGVEDAQVGIRGSATTGQSAQMADCITRQICAVMRRTGLEVELASLAA